MELKTKMNKWTIIKLKGFMHSKGNYKQGEKKTLQMGGKNNKWNSWQRINFQNIKPVHTTEYQENKQPNKKVGRRPKQTFLQRRHTKD